MMKITLLRLLTVSLAFLLVACGGGGSSTNTSSGGAGNQPAPVSTSAGVVTGTVTGFGSIIVDGQEYPEATTTSYQTDSMSDNQPLASDGVQLGQQVTLNLDASGKITHLVVVPEVEGSVSSITASVPAVGGALPAIIVANTLVVANSDPAQGPVTSFGGSYTALADIAVGGDAEVHGLLRSAGGVDYVQATYIGSRALPIGTRVTGMVAAYDALAGTFTVGSGSSLLTIHTTGITTLSPDGATLANGELVSVWSQGGISDGSLTAFDIKVRKTTAVPGQTVGVSGAISNFVSAASFVVNGQAVDASAVVLPAFVGALANGMVVAVKGNLNNAGVLVAGSLHVYEADTGATPPVDLHGTITDFVSAASFSVRGVVVDASQNPQYDPGKSAADLASGAFVEVLGTLSNNVVVAKRIHFVTLPADAVVDALASVVSYDAGSGLLTLDVKVPGQDGVSKRVAFTVDSSVSVVNGDVSLLTAGQTVSVHALLNVAELSFSVSSITLLPPPPPVVDNTVLLKGVITAVTPATGTVTAFTLHGLTINVGDASVLGIGDQPGLLLVGEAVVVYAQVTDGNTLTALKILGDYGVVHTGPVQVNGLTGLNVTPTFGSPVTLNGEVSVVSLANTDLSGNGTASNTAAINVIGGSNSSSSGSVISYATGDSLGGSMSSTVVAGHN
jgi:hypothetical protein